MRSFFLPPTHDLQSYGQWGRVWGEGRPNPPPQGCGPLHQPHQPAQPTRLLVPLLQGGAEGCLSAGWGTLCRQSPWSQPDPMLCELSSPAPLCLSLPPSRIHSFIHSAVLGCALFQGLCGLSHFPLQSPDSGHCLGSILLWKGQLSATRVGGYGPMDPTSMATVTLKGDRGKRPPWGPARTPALPICPWPLPLIPITVPFQPSSPALTRQGSVAVVPRLL